MPEQLKTSPAQSRGNHEVATDAPLKPVASPEAVKNKEKQLPTAGDFLNAINDLETVLKANHGQDFDAANWLKDPEEGSDDAVYASILNRVSDNNEPLRNYENEALRYMLFDRNLESTESKIDPRALGDDFGVRVESLLGDLKKRDQSLTGEDKQQSSLRIGAVQSTLDRLQGKKNEPSETALSDYFTLAESQFYEQLSDADKIKLEAAKSELHAAKIAKMEDMVTYDLMAQLYPLNTQEIAPVPSVETQRPVEKSQELLDAEEQLGNLRSQLAAKNAKREKRMWGVDHGAGDARHSHKNKELYAQYHAASRKVFELTNTDFLTDESIDNVEKIKMIAAHTVEEAKRLDLAILESYKGTKTFFGKAIEKYGNLSGTKKLIIGVAASAILGVTTGGVGTAIASGTFMATNFEAKRRKKREAGDDMISFDAEALAKKYYNDEKFDLSGPNADLAQNVLFDKFGSATRYAFENRIEKEQSRRARRVLGSYAAGATIGYLGHNFTGGLFDGLNTPADASYDVTAAHAAPDPSGAGSENLGGWWGDGAGVPHDVPSIDMNIAPSDVYVSPGDGFYDVFNQMNIPESQWNTILEKVGPELVQHGDAYWMPDGTVGISSPGQMSQYALDVITKARGY